jgi:hypothetical protein
MVGSAVLLEWWVDPPLFSVATLVAVTALATVGEIVELISGALGASKAGGSWRGSLGALLGAIAGGIAGTIFIPVPVVGSILGLCGGAFAGTFVLESLGGRSDEESIRIGKGAALGRLLGVLAKLILGAAIWVVLVVAGFW